MTMITHQYARLAIRALKAMASGSRDDIDALYHPEYINRMAVERLFRRYVPMTDAYYGQHFVIRKAGVVLATSLLAVLVIVEVTDIVFAVDSIPAIFAVTSQPFLVFTANAFAILGLRAMYFLLADLIHRFVYLKIGLALVLIWVGIRMMLKVDSFYIPTTLSLAVVASIIGVSIVASLRAMRGQGRQAPPTPGVTPFRVVTAEELAACEQVWKRKAGPTDHSAKEATTGSEFSEDKGDER